MSKYENVYDLEAYRSKLLQKELDDFKKEFEELKKRVEALENENVKFSEALNIDKNSPDIVLPEKANKED